MGGRRGWMIAAGSIGALLGASPAAADSLVYIKSGQVWISHADGTSARPVTQTDNNWAWPSEADDGTIVAVGGLSRINPGGTDSDGSDTIYRLSQAGTQLSSFPTFGSLSSPACPTYGPSSVRVSPDGRTVAYAILNCGDSSFATYFTPASSTGLDFPHQTTGQEDYVNPTWVDSGHILVTHDGPTVGDTQSVYGTVAIADDATQGGPTTVGDSDTVSDFQTVVDRAADRLAFVEDDHADWIDGKPRLAKILLFTLGGSALAPPTPACTLTLDPADFTHPQQASPSFSPDGSRLAWGMDDGVHVLDTTNLAACGSAARSLLVPGGAEPQFSAGLEVEPSPVAVRPLVKLGVASPKPTRAGRLAVAVSCPAAVAGGCRVTLTLSTAKRIVVARELQPRKRIVVLGSAKATVPAGTRRTVALKLSKKRLAVVRRLHAVRCRLTAVARDGAGHTATATKVLVVRRRT